MKKKWCKLGIRKCPANIFVKNVLAAVLAASAGHFPALLEDHEEKKLLLYNYDI
jgi:hypothetical protein